MTEYCRVSGHLKLTDLWWFAEPTRGVPECQGKGGPIESCKATGQEGCSKERTSCESGDHSYQ